MVFSSRFSQKDKGTSMIWKLFATVAVMMSMASVERLDGAEVLFPATTAFTCGLGSQNPAWKIQDPQNTDGLFMLKYGADPSTPGTTGVTPNSSAVLFATVQGCAVGTIVQGCPFLLDTSLPIFSATITANGNGNFLIPVDGALILSVPAGQAAFQVWGLTGPGGSAWSSELLTLHSTNPPQYGGC